MIRNKTVPNKKYFTVAEANAALPLIRVIVQDIANLAGDLRERHERLTRLIPSERGALTELYQEELHMIQSDLERAQERMQEYEQELHALGVELKDYYSGLIDFPAWMNNHEVYLCWRLGEPTVSHWHEIDAGFAGRQKLMMDASSHN